jgi:hypothetical protein
VLAKEKIEVFNKFSDHLKAAGEVENLSKRGENAAIRLLEIEKEEKANQKKIEETESRYQTAKEARKRITETYHPVNLETGEKQTPEAAKKILEESYATLEFVAEQAECTDKQKKKLEKSKNLIGSMIAYLVFYFHFLSLMIKTMGLDEPSTKVFETVVSIKYLEMCLGKTKNKRKKQKIKDTLERLNKDLEDNPIWQQMSDYMKTEWGKKALECAQVFQRSSSCVEGRNGQLSLKFHAFRRVTAETLRVFTVYHNFYIKRADGTTAAERFFGQKPRDLFTYLLSKVKLSRPRQNHKRCVKGSQAA